MTWPRQIGLLSCTLLVAIASAKGGGGATSGPLRPELDRALNHPALRVVNGGNALVRVRLMGPVRRDVLVPAGEATRTLLAAGDYRYEVWRGDRVVLAGVLRLQRGRRYHLEVAP